jgi:endonuclease/exonuclease/phosphatase family metal-dependent hydrolase
MFKSFSERVLIFVLAALMLSGLCSCTFGTTPDGDTTGCDTGSVQTVLTLVNSGKSDYVIIYPEDCSDKLITSVNNLKDAIKNYTGAALKAEGDLLPQGKEPDSNAKEILVGLTNRPESTENISENMKSGSYVVCVAGNKLVIGGVDSSSTADAVEYFIRRFIKSNKNLANGKQDGTLTFSSVDNYKKEASKMISSIKINGIDIGNYKIVVPHDGYIEKYIGQLFAEYISIFEGSRLGIVNDQGKASDYEIRIGKTSRTDIAVSEGKYLIKVTESGIEVLCSSVIGYTAALDALEQTVFKYTQSEIMLKNGDSWEGDDLTPDNIAKCGDIRVMYHNIWGYMNPDGSNPVANRSDIASQIYALYNPDVLCFEETSTAFRGASSRLFTYLANNSYVEICYPNDGGTGNPIFYNKNVLKLLESGYSKSRKGDKGTTWAVFEVISSGKVFGLTNSHFAADTNAGEDPVLGNQYRVEDAKTLLGAVDTILKKYPGISVLIGGDFNCSLNSDPYRTLTSAGLVNVHDVAAAASTVSPYHGTFTYDKENGYYGLQSSLSEGTAEKAIDHIMLAGTGIKVNVYSVLTDRISATTSDHCPHYADISLK